MELTDSPLQFPTDFPVKIMGRKTDTFAQEMLALVLQHAPDFNASTIEMRLSKNSTYLSLTCTIRATSREQLDQLYHALTAHPSVSIAL